LWETDGTAFAAATHTARIIGAPREGCQKPAATMRLYAHGEA